MKKQTAYFSIGHSIPTKIAGQIKSVNRSMKLAFIQIERINGKFARNNQRNVLAIPLNQIKIK